MSTVNTKCLPALNPISRHTLKSLATNLTIKPIYNPPDAKNTIANNFGAHEPIQETEKCDIENKTDCLKVQDKTAVPDSTTQVIKDKVQQFNNGEDVLVQHKDGRYYLGTIIAVDLPREQCLVKFYDNTERWSNVKELSRLNSSESDCGPLCVVCKTSSNKESDKIMVCDKCGRGYHQKCHTPRVSDSVVYVNGSWNCRRCVDQIQYHRKFENKCLRREIRRNSNTVVPQNQLPYDLSSLTWDAYHRVNSEQTYCYCGSNGDWFTQMLQCTRCKQWFHERCVGCLQYPLYCGDRFYVFVCSMCNYGTEFVRRLEMKWVDLVHLLLFNLTVYNNTKYYDLDNVIVPYANDNWHALQLPAHMKDISQPDLREQILLALSTHRNRFKCGRENKKKVSIWGLRSRLPPPGPCVSLGFNGVVTDGILRESWKDNKRLQFISTQQDIKPHNSTINRSNSYPGPNHPLTKIAQNSVNLRENMVVPLDSTMLAIMMGKAYRQNTNPSDSDSICSVELSEDIYKKDNLVIDEDKIDVKCYEMDYTGEGFVKKPVLQDAVIVENDDKRKCDDLKLILKIDNSDLNRKKKKLRNSTRLDDAKLKIVCPPTPPSSVTPPANSFLGSSSNDTNYYSTEKSSNDSRLELVDYESKDSDSVMHIKTVYDNLKSEFKNDICDSSDETSSRGTLDSIIPPPKDFQGKNNPFHSLPKTETKVSKVKTKAVRKVKKKLEDLPKEKIKETQVQVKPAVRTLKRKLSEKDLSVGENGEAKRRKFRRSRNRTSLPETSTASKTASYIPMLTTETSKEWPQRSLRSNFNSTVPQASTPISNCVEYALNGRRLRQRQDITYTETGRRNSNTNGQVRICGPPSSLPTSPTNKVEVCMTDLKSSVNMYFGAMNRILSGEKFVVQGKRYCSNGKMQYLIEWEGGPS